MIVEDDINSMCLMERFTCISGCCPLSTARGENVLIIAEQERPAAIFLEIRLPGISGWEILHDLKADPITCRIPVIICTALNEAARAREAGAGYLHKPVYYQDFLTALAEVGIDPPSS